MSHSASGINKDSLWQIWSDESLHDTIRLDAMRYYSWQGYLFTDPDSAFYFATLQYEFAEETGYPRFSASALNTMGTVRLLQGDYEGATGYLEESVAIAEENGDKAKVASGLNNLASVYTDLGNFTKAVETYFKCLSYLEEMNDLENMAAVYNNLGVIYDTQGFFDLAIKYHKESLEIKEEIKDDYGIACSFANLGASYNQIGRKEKSLNYYYQAMDLFESSGHPEGVASMLNNISDHLLEKGQFDKGIEHGERALKIYRNLDNKKGIAASLKALGTLYMEIKNYSKAEKLLAESYEIINEMGVVENMKDVTRLRYELYKKQGKSAKALIMYEEYILYRDSIAQIENLNSVIRQKYEYDYEKQALIDSLNYEAEREISDLKIKESNAQLRKERTQRYALYGGISVFAILALVILQGYRRKKKDNIIINQQKEEVEEQRDIAEKQRTELDRQHVLLKETHKEITDSIQYARYLQHAILPSTENFNDYLKDHFVFFNPKDVVSGDFYWFEPISSDELLLAVADCTGHGVPGSMVSVVCSNALNRSVIEFKLKEPNEILNKTRELVRSTFARSGKQVRDGMDIVLCSIRNDSVVFAGANRPLWIVRDKTLLNERQLGDRTSLVNDTYGLIELKCDKQAVGYSENEAPFKQWEERLYPGDRLFLFSDGYADQFGGPFGKKFKKRPFKELLVNSATKNIQDQGEIVKTTFNNWKGDLEQVDDICLIGVTV